MMNNNEIRIKKKHLTMVSIAVFVVSAMILGQVLVREATAGTLLNITVARTNDLLGKPTYYFIQFTTATTGTINTIWVTPQGSTFLPDVVNSKLISATGIGAGTLVGGLSGLLTYTVNSAVSVPAGTKISLLVANISNGASFGCYNFGIETRTIANILIDSGATPSFSHCNTDVTSTHIRDNTITAADIATDAITGDELAGFNNIRFGTCSVNPPSINDNSHLYYHVVNSVAQPWQLSTCFLGGLTGSNTRVIAFPGDGSAGGPADAGLHPRLVPKGSYAHCGSGLQCHLDVVIKNTAPAGGSVDDVAKTWVWLAFN